MGMGKPVVRILLYTGEDEWLERTLGYSSITTGKPYRSPFGQVEEIFRGTVPDSASLAEALALLIRGSGMKFTATLGMMAEHPGEEG